MNNYEEEATMYQNNDNEATQYQEATSANNAANESSNKEGKRKSNTWARAAVGAASGILIGAVSTTLMSMTTSDAAESSDNENDNHKEELSHPEWVDDEVSVATGVNDDMSFGHAFAAARAEVGPGGVFEWHGQLYGTYTADEWNHMTAEERAEYGDHFSWSHIDHSQSQVAQHSSAAQHTQNHQTAQVNVEEQDPIIAEEPDKQQETQTDDEDIEVVSVNHDDSKQTAQNEQPQNPVDEPVLDHEPEIEVIGVVHNDESVTNLAFVHLGGQDAILVDIDNDLTFDYMASDVNGNGEYEDNEIVDISHIDMTVDDLGGFCDPKVNFFADNEGPDYTNDTTYDA